MKIILAVIFLFFIYARPVHSIRLQDMDVYEEKGKIIEKVTPVREEREKNLHPFVQDVREDTENSFDYAGKVNTPIELERKTPYIKTPAANLKPNAWINFIFISIIGIAFLLSYFFIRPKSK